MSIISKIYVADATTTPCNISNMYVPLQLTVEEEKELSRLDADHASMVKKTKLDLFKALPRKFRQSVINQILWTNAVEEINNTSVPQSGRQEELAERSRAPRVCDFIGGAISSDSQHSMLGWPISEHHRVCILPNGITKDDLLQAHLDASIEEEMCNAQEE